MDKLKFANITKDNKSRVDIYEKKTNEYVKFGQYNSFPNDLIELYNNSSIHNTCINAIVDGIVGEGLTADPEYVLDTANSTSESWNDIFKKVAQDYKLYGGFAMEVIWNKSRTRIAEVYHIDFSWLRAKEKNYRGQIPGYYVSDEWATDYRYGQATIDDVPYLPMYNPHTNVEEPKQLYVFNPYRPGQKYYPLPDYVGALRVIELDTEVDNFHINNIMNGLAPSLMVTTFTNANEEEREAIERMLKLQYSGTNNAGNLMYIDVDSPENAPKIEPIPQNGADGYYVAINDMVTQKILTAHRITSPMILGIKTPGQLGGRDEVTDAYLLLVNTVIRPYQQNILQVFEDLLDQMYPELDITVGVQQLKLFTDGSEETDVVTSIDAEVGEDSDLESDIEKADRDAEVDSNLDLPITELPLI
tara:strand:- start:681 stop:1931 length:1251 start_codon:yes stop_codon:yes gene_type:complete